MKKTQNRRQIEAIKDFFARNEIIDTPFMLNKWTKVENPKLFIEAHISMIEAMDEKIAEPYINRLRELAFLILNKKIYLEL
jgi:hypothetical protein